MALCRSVVLQDDRSEKDGYVPGPEAVPLPLGAALWDEWLEAKRLGKTFDGHDHGSPYLETSSTLGVDLYPKWTSYTRRFEPVFGPDWPGCRWFGFRP